MRLSRPTVKSTLEHLRSCLEYAAHDISDAVITKPAKRVYFPYGPTKERFEKMVGECLPGLQGAIFRIVESIQPHACGDDWLNQLCTHTNVNKHDSLQHQRREDVGAAYTKVGPFAVDATSNLTIGKLYQDGRLLNPDTPLMVNHQRTVAEIAADVQNLLEVVREYDDVKFIFTDTGVNVLDILRKGHDGISAFTVQLYQALPAKP